MMVDGIARQLRRIGPWSRTTKGLMVVSTFFFTFFLWSALQYHADPANKQGHSPLQADASGYYVYLPGLFHYDFQAHNVPDSLPARQGHGFTLDRTRDRVVTKYFYGTAVLELPFFLVADLVSDDTEGEWTLTHIAAIRVSGIFYWSLGLLLLGLALHRRWGHDPGLLVLTLSCAAFGTNSFYYAFREPGYSHVYSFFLTALALFAIWRDTGRPLRSSSVWLAAFACAMICWVRLFDVLLSAAVFLLLLVDRSERRVAYRAVLAWVTMFLTVAAPQCAYWWYVHGTPFFYSYGDEGFSRLSDPKLAEVLFAPENGLLPYSPVLALVPFGLVVLAVRDRGPALIILATCGLALFGFASWHSWHFGCAYGMRPFVQYVPLAAIPLFVLFRWLRTSVPMVLHGAVPIIVLVCFVSYRAMLHTATCYPGETWKWLRFGENLIEAFFGGVDINA